MTDLSGKVALITGGGTGLGQVIAQLLAQEGMNLAIQYSRSAQEAAETVQLLEKLGVKAKAVQADLNSAAKVANIKRMVEEVGQEFGRLDLLINNAGTTRPVPYPDLDSVTEDDWDTVLNVNTKAPFFLAQAAAPLLRQSKGSIINTSSISGLRGRGGSSIAYSVSKAATIHLTKCLANALAPDIRVNTVAPGFLRTRWNTNFTSEQLEAIQQQAPLKKAADLEDTAAVYLMLARNESMTGQVITVDAGVTVS